MARITAYSTKETQEIGRSRVQVKHLPMLVEDTQAMVTCYPERYGETISKYVITITIMCRLLQ
ncbi:MAG: hypothetical protein RR238_02425 [Lachnospiraceae bacterium]